MTMIEKLIRIAKVEFSHKKDVGEYFLKSSLEVKIKIMIPKTT